MACLKCGSDWVTLKGKDKISCPECCKQQRCKARKQGRLPVSETKACERCGQAFEAVGGNAMARSSKCRSCAAIDLSSRERQKRYRHRVKAGLKIPGRRATLDEARRCGWCDKELDGASQRKYCSKRCFADARKAGKQSWDRTSQMVAMERSCAIQRRPSAKGLRAVLNGFRGFMQRLSRLRRQLSCRCLNCGNHHVRDRSDFCGDECRRAYRWLTECRRCSRVFITVGGGGSKKRLCRQCKKEALKQERRRIKKDCGTYKKRCLKYGGYYNREVTRPKVFSRDQWRCHVCRKKTLRFWANNHPREATVDHFPIPLSHGGDHDWHNVRCACRKCNSERGNKWDGQKRLVLAD